MKFNRNIKALSWGVAILVGIACHSIVAQDDIPKTSGFSGFALLGPGYFNVEHSLLVTGAPLLDDVGTPQIESIFDPPPSGSAPALLVGFELNYTFSSTRTQLYLGSRLEDLLRLDILIGLGVRQELPDSSILAASLLLTPLELKYWSDPYIEGEDRKRTGLYFPGIRIRWGRILKTGLELTVTARQYQFDEENSGNWLVSEGRLNPDQRSLLNRDGDVLRLQALYRFDFKSHRFEPAVRYSKDSHNGAAISNNGFSLRLTYLYLSPKVVIDFNVFYGKRKSDEIHPVYDKVLDAERWGVALTVFIPVKRFDSSVLSVFVSGEIFRENANIDFFESKISSINGGLIWRFIRN
jgi:hypothetical protein